MRPVCKRLNLHDSVAVARDMPRKWTHRCVFDLQLLLINSSVHFSVYPVDSTALIRQICDTHLSGEVCSSFPAISTKVRALTHSDMTFLLIDRISDIAAFACRRRQSF